MVSQFKRLSQHLVSFIVRAPWISVVLGIALTVGLATGLGQVRTNFTHTAFFRDTDPDLQRFNAFERQFGNDDAVIVVVNSPSGIFDEDSATLLRTLTERMWLVPEVIRVDSLANFQWVHAHEDDIKIEALFPTEGPLTPQLLHERKQIALNHELLPGYLISDDGTTALVYAHIKPGIDAPPDSKTIVAESRKLIAELQRSDHVFHLTGGPAINDAFRESSEGDMSVLVPALLAMVALMLVVTFRRVGGVVLPFIVVILTVTASLAMAGWFGIELSSVTIVLPQVLIAICVADTVHLLTGFYRARKAGLSRRAAAEHTLNKNFIPTLLTSITTAVGFFSFATADLPPVSGFGVLAGVGTLLAWVISYLVVGGLLVVWPGKEPADGSTPLDAGLMQSGPWSRAFVGFVDRYRIALLAGFTLVTVASLGLGLRNVVNSNPYEYFSARVPVRQAQDFVLSHLSGTANFELVIDSGVEEGVKDPEFMRKVEAFEARALAINGINRSVSLVDILRQTNRALSGGSKEDYKLPDTKEGIAQELLMYTMGLPRGMDVNDRITVKNDAMRVTLISTITDSNEAVDTARRLEAIGAELGLDVHTTGKTMLYQSMNGHVVNSFIRSLALAVALVGTIILLSFGSAKMALLSAIPNLVPLFVGAGALYAISGTVDIGTVMVGSVCLGIAVDNTIHIVTSYQLHKSEGKTGRDAFERLLTHTGPAMISTTVILVLGFSTLAFGTFVPNVYFGLLSAIILGFGLVTDIVLLPAVLLTLERWRATKVNAQPRLAEPS